MAVKPKYRGPERRKGRERVYKSSLEIVLREPDARSAVIFDSGSAGKRGMFVGAKPKKNSPMPLGTLHRANFGETIYANRRRLTKRKR